MSELNTLLTRDFIDTNYGDWYDQGLPPAVAEVYPNGLHLPERLEEFEGQDIPQFEDVLTNIMVRAHEPENAYHTIGHAHRVTENTYQAYDALAVLRGVHIPAGFLHPVLCGTAAHDEDHPGTTFFADAEPHRIPESATEDMAVEWHSAHKISSRLADIGASPEQQAVAAYIPAASAYGAHEPQGQRLGIGRAANPKGISGKIMRAVDVVPAEGMSLSFIDDTAVMYGEKRPGGQESPQTMADLLTNRLGFLQGYVLPQFDKLDLGVKADLTAYVGWRDRVERQISEVEKMRQKGAVVARAILRSQLEAKYGVTIA